MRYFKFIAVLAVAFASAGCLRMTYTLNLKPDGSGTIVHTLGMSKASMQQLTAMMSSALGVENAPGSATQSPFPTADQLKEKAAQMGEGVRFVSATPLPGGAFEGQ